MSSDICRICLGGGLLPSNLFEVHPVHSKMLSTIIMSLARVQIYPHDGLPNRICKKCLKTLDKILEFVQICENSESKLRNSLIVQSHIPNLNKTYENSAKNEDYNASTSSPKSETRDLLIDEDYSNTESLDTTKTNVKLEHESNVKSFEKMKQKQQCFTCGKVMSSRFRLKTHLRTHTGEKPYSCSHCHKKFSLAENLRMHLRVHTGEKPLRCTECDQTFAHSAALTVHMRKHSGLTPYCCILCPRSFRTIGHLQYHTRRHTGEKKFECDVCSRAFITKSDLKQHTMSHTGDKPYVCSICGLRLSRSAHLKRHINHKHKIDNVSQHTCEHSSVKFNQKRLIENHSKEHSEIEESSKT